MSAVNDLAGRVLGNTHLEQGGRPKIDLATIIVIIKVVVLLYQCLNTLSYDPDDVRRPGFFARWKLHRIVKRTLKKHGNLDELDAVMNGLYGTAETLTDDEIADVIAEANRS